MFSVELCRSLDRSLLWKMAPVNQAGESIDAMHFEMLLPEAARQTPGGRGLELCAQQIKPLGLPAKSLRGKCRRCSAEISRARLCSSRAAFCSSADRLTVKFSRFSLNLDIASSRLQAYRDQRKPPCRPAIPFMREQVPNAATEPLRLRAVRTSNQCWE